MSSDGRWVWILVLAAWGTWLERVGPWFLMTKLGPRLEKYSRYAEIWVENFVPAIVTILWIRSIPVNQHLGITLWEQFAAASVVTVVVAWISNSLAVSVLTGMVSYWLGSFIR
ncbi:MAG: AzlD domain-containing protein [Firmicutes bacterium]|jgi:branched-subunit amino acid transport protein|uniref:Branched-chain amino acid ABC transporter n=1 Tax=Sulfobacillus benefaciens TaxID=453960 RepID=A0A2T2X1H9_9FIRM|nr:AzlD domain-containing protein [Bacillota bacterium]MCL5013901.1 AzlD domain-containing protein [Bacillota bacterium]PSR28353.1 MAG: hypothetical protein C7B43_10260 [Sulfobacillus benefaciens]HBQ95021.1 hypothetical protein [Sulfobacillus sp.]